MPSSKTTKANEPSGFDSDLLELKPFAERLEKWLTVEHDFVEGSLVVALEAAFGSGKTTIIEMWKGDLMKRRNAGEFCPMPVVLNAWESDYCGEPLVAILAGLQEALEDWHGEDKPKNLSEFKEAAKDVAYFGLALANGFVANATGLDPMEAGEATQARKDKRKPEVPDFIAHYRHRKDALNTLQKEMSEAFGGSTPKVIVFVDELDRCRPDYAVSYLETIKHVFNLKGMVFVLAIDYPHLMNSTKSLFGQGLNFPEYFRKFCHRQFKLPECEQQGYARLSAAYIKKYVHLETRRSGLPKGDDPQSGFSVLAACFRLNPRQLQEAFRIIGHAMSTEDEESVGNILWGYWNGLMLLSFLRVAHPAMFGAILAGNPNHHEIGRMLIAGLGSQKAEWWIKLLLTGSMTDSSPPGFLSENLTRLNYEVTPISDNQLAGEFKQGWGYGMGSESRLSNLCYRIESAATF